jgi:murein DD-endopeptidase MepM/ murein hydrolase activator NlpD
MSTPVMYRGKPERRRFGGLRAYFPLVVLATSCLGMGTSLLLTACSQSEVTDVQKTASPSSSAVPEARRSPAGVALYDFTLPIAGACLPGDDNLMPNAVREYRSGTHEGVDFYWWDNCVPIGAGTPVIAVKDGTVIRADLDYDELTPEQMQALLDRTYVQGFTDGAALDRFGGRQVWIDHGDGIVTTYNHLGGIAHKIEVGSEVLGGQIIGYVGDSGTPQSVTAPGTEVHLHFEVWMNDIFLGKGLPADRVRAMYERLFGITSPAVPAAPTSLPGR